MTVWDGGIGPSFLAIALSCFYGILSYGIHGGELGVATSHGWAQTILFVLVSLCIIAAHDLLRRQLQTAASAALSASEGMVVLDDQGRVTWANETAEHLLDHTRHELAGKTVHGTICRCSTGPAPSARGTCLIVEAVRTGTARQETAPFQRRDGSEFSAKWNLSLIPHGGRARAAVLTFHDNTALEDLLAGLRNSEQLYRSFLERAPMGALVIDEYGYVVIANERACELFGYETPQSMMALSTQHLLAPEDRLRCSQDRHTLLETGGYKLTELTAQSRDGTTRRIEFAMSVMPDDGSEIRKLAVITDEMFERHPTPEGLYIDAHGGEPDPEMSVAGILAESKTLVEAMPRMLQVLCSAGGWDAGTFWTVDRQDNVLRCQAIWRLPTIDIPEFEILCQQLVLPPGMDLPGRVWTSRKALWVPDVIADPAILRALMASKEGLRSAFGFPLIGGSAVYGVVEMLSREVRPPSAYLEDKMNVIGRQMGRFLARQDVELSSAHQSQYDPVTRVASRVLLISRISRAMVNARAARKCVALLVVSVDTVQQVRDLYGPESGDLVLRHAAARIQSALRESDTVARLDSDQFGVLLPGTSLEGSRVVTEKILEASREPITIEGHEMTIGCTVGIALYPDHATDIESLIQRSDAAMYAARKSHSGYCVHNEHPRELHG